MASDTFTTVNHVKKFRTGDPLVTVAIRGTCKYKSEQSKQRDFRNEVHRLEDRDAGEPQVVSQVLAAPRLRITACPLLTELTNYARYRGTDMFSTIKTESIDQHLESATGVLVAASREFSTPHLPRSPHLIRH